MPFDYTTLSNTAQRLLRDFGRLVTLSKKNRSPADSNKPWRGPSAPDTTTIAYAVVTPNNLMDEAGDIVRRGDATAYIAAKEVPNYNLEQFDTLIDGSKVWKIVGVDVLNPGSTRLLYVLSLKE